MYTTAELFAIATDPETSRAAFLNNVTLSIPDGADGCVDNLADSAYLRAKEDYLMGR